MSSTPRRCGSTAEATAAVTSLLPFSLLSNDQVTAQNLSVAQRVHRLRQATTSMKRRALSAAELAALKTHRNSVHGEVYVAGEGSLVLKDMLDQGLITDCDFYGSFTLVVDPSLLSGDFRGGFLPWGRWARSRFEGANYVSLHSDISSCAEISNTIVFPRAKLIGCAKIACSRPTSYGNGAVDPSPGHEPGGRVVRCVAESTLEQIARVAMDRSSVDAYDAAVKAYEAACAFGFTVVGPDALLSHAGTTDMCFLDAGASIESGSRATQATLLAKASLAGGSDVSNAILQSGARVESTSLVRDSLLCSGAKVSLHGKLLHSVLGPGNGLAEGEMTASLVGPMVGFHHQSLLISAFWPVGRGNVGYGANAGSNHTSRAPDQSLWPGEGVFFGLGSSTKFPLNLSEAPYTIIATGVTYGPGRLSFPFSLVTDGGRVAPGWGVVSNAYALERAEAKSSTRGVAGYAKSLFRPSIMELVSSARDVLLRTLEADPAAQTFRDVEGQLNLGGGHMTRQDAFKGVQAYTFLLMLYALRVLSGAYVERASADSKEALTFDPAETGLEPDPSWVKSHAASTLLVERKRDPSFLPDLKSASSIRSTWLALEREFAAKVRKSKSRDYSRGASVFPGPAYRDAAGSLEDDAVIRRAETRVKDIQGSSRL